MWHPRFTASAVVVGYLAVAVPSVAAILDRRGSDATVAGGAASAASTSVWSRLSVLSSFAFGTVTGSSSGGAQAGSSSSPGHASAPAVAPSALQPSEAGSLDVNGANSLPLPLMPRALAHGASTPEAMRLDVADPWDSARPAYARAHPAERAIAAVERRDPWNGGAIAAHGPNRPLVLDRADPWRPDAMRGTSARDSFAADTGATASTSLAPASESRL